MGQAGDGRDAVSLALSMRPDVVVMDLQMPEVDGVEATRQIAERLPDTAVLVLTMHDDDASVFAAIRAGARGYLLKGAGQEDVARAIAAVQPRRGDLTGLPWQDGEFCSLPAVRSRPRCPSRN